MESWGSRGRTDRQTDPPEQGCARCGCEGPVSMATAQIHSVPRGFLLPSLFAECEPLANELCK